MGNPKLILLICHQRHDPNDWSLHKEIAGSIEYKKLLDPNFDGVARVGADSFLFDETKRHGVFVRLCSYLQDKKWPYVCVRVDPASILVEGKCSEKLTSILEKSWAHDPD